MMQRILRLVAVMVMFWGLAAQAAFATETVVVGDPGNATDTRYESPGVGSVGYAYNIGQYEVTNAQYIAFLNAVATTDAHGLYNIDMNLSDFGGITRAGDPGGYTYGPKNGDDNWLHRPVNFVGFWDTLRFANWMHNGQPTGGQNNTTTEDGAYTLDGYTGGDGTWISRNAGATWVLPSEDEWYKAAFYKGGSADAGYWDYPTQTDLIPSNDILDPDPGNNANFWQGGYSSGGPYFTTEVGEFENSISAYDTFDQGGNLWEWNETLLEGVERGMRGGGFHSDSHEHVHLHASNRSHRWPTDENSGLGFRVGYVPEPSTVMLLGAASLLALRRRRRAA